MDIANPVNRGNAILLASARAVVQRFQVGQILQAMVVSAGGGRAVLDLNGQRLGAATDVALRQGQAIELQVERARNPVVLKVLPEARGQAEVERRALRSSLPRQAAMAPLLANLQTVATATPGIPRPPANPLVADAASQLLQSLPGPRQMTSAEGVREALRHSGTFFEAGLRHAAEGVPPATQRDLKGQLLRLLAILTRAAQPATPPARGGTEGRPAAQGTPPTTRTAAEPQPPRPEGTPRGRPETAAPTPTRTDPGPPPMRGQTPPPQPPAQPSLTANSTSERVTSELRQQTESAIHRLQIHQLNSLPAEDGARLNWSMEVPVRRDDGTDIFSLRIGRDQAGAGDDGDTEAWTVEIGFELEELGALSARLTLRGGRLSAVLWAEEATTAGTIQSHLGELQAELEGAGLDVARLGIFAGRPPGTTPDGGHGPARLLSITA
ncbi:MAG: flagellar hook-length control protein FliK [Gammaproteobacteria bacterium]|nr:flagellar hook-length control protein FliK [Gammaproteobacteria bacterium]